MRGFKVWGPGTECKETNISDNNIMLEGNLHFKNPLGSVKIKHRILYVSPQKEMVIMYRVEVLAMAMVAIILQNKNVSNQHVHLEFT